MFIQMLGSAAGGGFPQWNCACRQCGRARSGDPSVRPRTGDSLAVSPDGKSWALLNASPDVCLQTELRAPLRPGPVLRGSPIRAVLLTDAELDHTIGLLQLRLSSGLEVYAAPPVLRALEDAFPVRRMLGSYGEIRWSEARPGDSFPLFGGQLTICPFDLGGKPPRYVPTNPQEKKEAWAVGYRVTDRTTGGVAVYAPGVESWSRPLEEHLEGADAVFLDGTFWRGDELRDLGASELDAADMGHLPVAGPHGSAERFARMPTRRKIYTHINNTNPMLDERSPERRLLAELGIEVGYDGLEMEV
ncbi:pyrroloquinoline quinone biosynthesis protein PqqB [Paenibacillaceae bacterium WGS1546]|uniref:pyrroloquinoline quinone biosynthesis protein PqqB n=1 Tax=Cohnella sp. WGS1546 TaxID=3366810 RepID=UPI00372D5474